MYVCMHVCVYIYVYIYSHSNNSNNNTTFVIIRSTPGRTAGGSPRGRRRRCRRTSGTA